MNKEDFINDIQRKLCNNVRLTGEEIHCVLAALRESSHCLCEPYYEVVFHNEYGQTESRIMNPVHQGFRPVSDSDNCVIISDHFEVDFNRIVRKENDR